MIVTAGVVIHCCSRYVQTPHSCSDQDRDCRPLLPGSRVGASKGPKPDTNEVLQASIHCITMANFVHHEYPWMAAQTPNRQRRAAKEVESPAPTPWHLQTQAQLGRETLTHMNLERAALVPSPVVPTATAASS